MGKNAQNGFALVEVLIGAAVSLVILLGLTGMTSIVAKLSRSSVDRIQTSFLMEEGLEVARFLRDENWDANVANRPHGAPFYIAWSGNTWDATSTNVYVDGVFERSLTWSDVYREGNNDIVTSGGTLDPNTVKATVSLSWNLNGATTTRTLSTYFTNIFDENGA